MREGVAEQALEGVLPARAYRAAEPYQCALGSAGVRKRADRASEQSDQLVFGEVFDALEEADGWVFGKARRDGYVGWVERSALVGPVLAPTHRISAIRTYAFPQPDVVSAPPLLLTLNSLVTVDARQDRFCRAARAGWIVEEHLAALDVFEDDAVAVAERHLGSPYLWGGRESWGLDCSGLVQQALFACGRACPRDADQQERELGREVAPGRRFEKLVRGDLIFWDGHVAMVAGANRLIHATRHHMQVAYEPLTEAVERIRASGFGEPRSFKRL
jgi:cell wall-associated NlpC family hydrolase